MSHDASKIVIITEKIIADGVASILEREGATGYTIVAAGGKGSRGVRSATRPAIVADFSNVKIEAIVPDMDMAERIADAVAAEFFENYSGITYLEPVQILRRHKFVAP